MISIALLATIIMAVSMMLRGSFDIRLGLAEKNRVKHRMSVAMEALHYDLSHAFIISTLDQKKLGDSRFKTPFEIKEDFQGDQLRLTTFSHTVRNVGSKESEVSDVYYQLKEDPKRSGVKHLYRGSSGRLSFDLKEMPKTQLLIRNVKSIIFIPWRGDSWLTTSRSWNSIEREMRNKIPRLVKIRLEVYLIDFEEEDESGESQVNLDDAPTEMIETAVYIASSVNFKEYREPNSTLRWEF